MTDLEKHKQNSHIQIKSALKSLRALSPEQLREAEERELRQLPLIYQLIRMVMKEKGL